MKWKDRKKIKDGYFYPAAFIEHVEQTNIEEAEKIADQIKEKCKEEKEDPIKPSVSVGFSVKEHVNQDINDIYKTAEDRMYSVKLMERKALEAP
jgi:GGDEF domain-containing protein